MARFGRGSGGNVAEIDAPGTPDAEAEANAADVEDVSGAEVTPEAEVVNLNGFWAVVDALDPENPNYDAVKAEYDKLSRKGKFQATRGIASRIIDRVEQEQYDEAQKLTRVKKYFASLSPTSTPTVTDPTTELVKRIAALDIAKTRLLSENEGLTDRVNATIATPDEKTQALVGKLVEMRAARKPRKPGGKRHNVTNHIKEVFANVASGEWMDFKQIAAATSSEYDGPANEASVAGKLNSKKGLHVDGLTVETRDDKIGVLKN